MTLAQGDKVLVVGSGSTRNNVGYIVGETTCHYVLFFMDGQSSQVWKQNVLLLNGDNQTEKESSKSSVESSGPLKDCHKESIQSQLSRAIARQQVTANEIADLVYQLTGVLVESPPSRKSYTRRG
mmetsp:Transcript_29416/g.42077  ORF Transcript_29416/g.42077 Transcript_29416/m.42077 type:complete len:125 (-) Transcript_29416:33-407(-)